MKITNIEDNTSNNSLQARNHNCNTYSKERSETNTIEDITPTNQNVITHNKNIEDFGSHNKNSTKNNNNQKRISLGHQHKPKLLANTG